jgi:hypothetical protein
MADQASPEAAFPDNQGGAAFDQVAQTRQRSSQIARLAKTNPNLARVTPNLTPDQLPRG